jgi:tetratricopeptide (TPR) repeat protein
MSDSCSAVHRSQTSSSAFLLSQSDVCKPLPAHGPGTDESAARILEALADLPDSLLTPEMLQEAALKRLEKEKKFSVLVIGIDDFHISDNSDGLALNAASAVVEICRDYKGFWGVFDADKLACFLPGKDSKECGEIAQRLLDNLNPRHTQTVTTGIASYPLLDFDKSEILINAQKALEHAEFFGPGAITAFDAVSLNISGDKYYQAGDIEGAVSEFKKAIEIDPDNVNVLNSLGVCYGVKEELELAMECFTKAAELDPGEIMALYNAGYVHMSKGENEKALEYFEKAGKINPGVFEVAFQTGRVYLESGRPQKARKFLETAVSITDKSGAAHRYLADCYLSLDRDIDAATAYKTALKLRPDDAEALSALGYLYEMQGKNADIALMFCQRAVEMAPENGLFRHRLGRIYFCRNMGEEAVAEFQAACDCGQDSLEYLSLAREMAAASDPDRRMQG